MRVTSRAADKKPQVNNNLKTYTMVQRTAYMIEDGVPASSILMFTFTKKAANEIKERIEKAIGDKAYGVTVSTYHSFCARQLRKFAAYAGYKDNFSIIDDDEQVKLVTHLLKKADSKSKPQEILANISHFKSKHLTPTQAATYYKGHEDGSVEDAMMESLLIYEQYQKNLKKNNSMDFDDLLFNMVTILEKNEIVRQQIWNRYKYITVDESQDSSTTDVKLIFLISNPRKMNLCMVGDSDQAIYAFRGADMENFYKVAMEKKPKTFVLGQNYRSTKTVVNSAQTLIRYNIRPDQKSLFTDNDEGEKILHVKARTQAAEATFIANQIHQLVEGGQMKYKDAAILYRASFLSRNMEDALIKAHVPYRLVGGVSFYKRKEVKDIVAMVDFMANPENLHNLERILAMEKGVGEKTVEKIIEETSQIYSSYAIINLPNAIEALDEAVSKNNRIMNKINGFITRLRNVQAWKETNEETPAELITKLITEFDYLNYLKKYDEETYEERAKNVTELINMAKTYTDTREFLEDVVTSAPEQEGDEAEQVDAVTLMTMHASKGLEYRIVYIIDANSGIVPFWKCASEKEVQEERRLFYVAMTRAKENLVIASTDIVIQSGRPRISKPSPFISQIDNKFIEAISI